MDDHIIFILVAGIATMAMFLLPALLKNRLLSVPMVFVVFGFCLYNLPLDLPFINPEENRFDRMVLEYLTEFIVIISLSAIGIKIDRKPSLANWKVAWYLLGIAMPITIVLLAVAGHYLMGMGAAAAILLGASLAPTDPVLAGGVQVDKPNSGDGHKVKFALTLEAGLNDGLAFPFIYLALIIGDQGITVESISMWAIYQLAYKIIAAIIIGYILGKFFSRYFLQFIRKAEIKYKSDISEGLFMISATLLVYGIAEAAEGYGFLAVFVAAVTGRQRDNSDEIHERAYTAIDQVEQALLSVFLIAFGGIMASGGLEGVEWEHVLIAFILIFIIRPVAGMISFIKCDITIKEKLIISFFGIRGVGTVYYLAYATNKNSNFPHIDDIWYIANVAILSSICIHGIGSALIMPSLNNDK